jgi:sialate O-acetylesterase
MIAPLGAYGLRGVAWYQGESNAYLAESAQYQQSLAALFADWRRADDEQARGERLGATA